MAIRLHHENDECISFTQIRFDPSEPDPYALEDMSISHKAFPLVFADASWFVHEVCRKDATTIRPARTAYIHFAILGLALAAEAAANCCIASLSLDGRTADEVERLPTLGKFDVFALAMGTHRSLDRGNSHVQALRDIVRLRDLVVHGKVDPVRYNGKVKLKHGFGIKRLPPKTSPHLQIPMDPSLWDPEHAALALRELSSFFNYFFLEFCALKPEQSRALLSSIMCEKGKPVAVLDDMPNHLITLTTEWGISMKFLCMARKAVTDESGEIICWEPI